jgi:hypothetical protein
MRAEIEHARPRAAGGRSLLQAPIDSREYRCRSGASAGMEKLIEDAALAEAIRSLPRRST